MTLSRLIVALSGVLLMPALALAGMRGAGSCPVTGGAGPSPFLFVILLAIGYWILTLSDAQKAPLDRLGRWIGGFILFAAIAGGIFSALCLVRCV